MMPEDASHHSWRVRTFMRTEKRVKKFGTPTPDFKKIIEILDLGAKIPKISKMTLDVFGPSGAAAGL